MNLPPREALLDIDWLTRTHATEGFDALLRYVRKGAETYGEPVTAVAEAVLHLLRWPPLPGPMRDAMDVRHGLAHALATGSWSSRLDEANRGCFEWILPALPPEKRAAWLARLKVPCAPPPLPDLTSLRLHGPLDFACVGHMDGIWGCEVSPDGRRLVSASRDGDVAVWDMKAGTLVARAETGMPEVRDCAVTPDGHGVISVHATGRVTIWDLETMTVRGSIEAPAGVERMNDRHEYQGSPRRWRRFAISVDGNRLALAGWDVIDIWNLERIELITTLRITAGLPQGMLALFFGSDGRLRTIGRDNPMPVLTWDIDAPRVVSVGLLETAHAAFFERAAITSDELVLVATGPRETTVWHLDSSKRLATVPHGANGQALAVSLDGTIAATAGHEIPGSHATFVESEALRLWSLPDLREIRCWKLRDFGCRDIACALAFGPDGKCLVVAGWEGVLRRVVLPAS